MYERQREVVREEKLEGGRPGVCEIETECKRGPFGESRGPLGESRGPLDES